MCWVLSHTERWDEWIFFSLEQPPPDLYVCPLKYEDKIFLCGSCVDSPWVLLVQPSSSGKGEPKRFQLFPPAQPFLSCDVNASWGFFTGCCCSKSLWCIGALIFWVYQELSVKQRNKDKWSDVTTNPIMGWPLFVSGSTFEEQSLTRHIGDAQHFFGPLLHNSHLQKATLSIQTEELLGTGQSFFFSWLNL